jgi:hypothetical protein
MRSPFGLYRPCSKVTNIVHPTIIRSPCCLNNCSRLILQIFKLRFCFPYRTLAPPETLHNYDIKKVKLIGKAVMDTPPIRLNDSGTRSFMGKTTPVQGTSSHSLNLDDQSHAKSGIVHGNFHTNPTLDQRNFVYLLVDMHCCKIPANHSLNSDCAIALVDEVYASAMASSKSLNCNYSKQIFFKSLSCQHSTGICLNDNQSPHSCQSLSSCEESANFCLDWDNCRRK